MSSNSWKVTVFTAATLSLLGLRADNINAQSSGATTGVTGTTGSQGTVGVSSTYSHAREPIQGQELESSESIVGRGETLSQRVTQMLGDARRESDMIRITCLNDKLTQINANLRTAQARQSSLQHAVDADQRSHELTVLTVLGQKLQVLEQEANQCVGQDLYDTGTTKVTTDIDTRRVSYDADPADTDSFWAPTPITTLGAVDASPTGASD